MRKFFKKIARTVRWLPIVWNDHDWDYFYLLKLMKFKLVNMEKFFRSHGQAVDSDHLADRIRICTLLLDRIIRDEYYDNAFRNHENKWGDLQMEIKDDRLADIYRERATSKEDRIVERKEARRLFRHEEYMIQQDLEFLALYIKKYLRTWWD